MERILLGQKFSFGLQNLDPFLQFIDQVVELGGARHAEKIKPRRLKKKKISSKLPESLICLVKKKTNPKFTLLLT